MNADGPSPISIEVAMSIAMAALSRLRESNLLDSDDTDDAAVLKVLEGHGVEVANLLERVVAAALEAEKLEEACAQRIDDLVTRRQRFAHLGEAWRGTALAMMDALDIKRHRAPEFTLTLGDGLQKVMIEDEAKLPEEYWRITREPNKIAIKDDLQQGVVIPGAELGIGAPRLIVRTR
jgi:Gp157 protein